MDKLIIEGGTPLRGEIQISGSKNGVLPILFATLLIPGKIVLNNIPRLRDIRTTINLLELLGCQADLQGNSLQIETLSGLKAEAPYDLVRTMRASILCLGPLLARMGQAKVALPGGCAIGSRPVDLHLKGLEKMGASFELEEGYIKGRASRLKGAHIAFDFPTVGGTENMLMAATLAQGETVLENAAREPEITDLANFLIACGANISGHGTSIITIQGVNSLHGTNYQVMADRIEAGTYMVAAAITKGRLTLRNCPLECMDTVIFKLQEMGVQFLSSPEGTTVWAGHEIQGIDLVTQPYPGFPTDMQAQIMALMCLAKGSGIIQETIFENRFMHALELMRMGAKIKLSGDTALIRGVPKLIGAPVMASDLRASASLVLAGLAAQGRTEIRRIYHLDRGYEQMERKLARVGARIWREKE